MGTPQLFALTTPLLTTSSGAKMGKSAGRCAERRCLLARRFRQYWRNTEDADVGRFLKIFTRLPLDEIARLEALGGSEINDAKKVLATEATAIVHGRERRRNRPPRPHARLLEEGALAGHLADRRGFER